MQNLGIVVAGSSLQEAMNILDVIEHVCQLIITCYSTSIKPSIIPGEEVKILHESSSFMV